jgi:hypothetical protein
VTLFGVQIFAGVVNDRGDPFVLTPVVNTVSDPEIVPGGRGLVVGFDFRPSYPGDWPAASILKSRSSRSRPLL